MRALIFICLLLSLCVQAHRTEGLLQASLVDIVPDEVHVEVTLAPGIDIAPQIIAILDQNRDGQFSESDKTTWSEKFMADQSVTLDQSTLPLKLIEIQASPLAEMNSGHAAIVVRYSASLGKRAAGEHTIAVANRYEPIPSAYQCNGLIPKADGVKISSHRRNEKQTELFLAAQISTTASAPSPAVTSSTGHSRSILLIVSLCAGAGLIAIAIQLRKEPIKS